MLSRALWHQALVEAGFSAGGVTLPAIPEADREAFERWLAAGCQADMEWMARTRSCRLSPSSFLPGVRSILVVGLDSWSEPVRLEGGGRLARYARGRDYHRFMGRRLKRLEALLGLGSARPALDIHPVLERTLAAGAGLGWLGKQSQLVSPRFGPWLLLGELFTSEELEPAAVSGETHGCGECKACLAACPTGALLAPGLLDSRRCLSYWSIEARTLPPPEIRAAQGEWLFGCDLCLEACPVRQAPAPAPDPDFRPILAPLTLADLLALDRAGYERRIRSTPLRRAGFAGLKRNAAVVAANLGRADLTGELTALLSEPEPTLRAAGGWALGRLGTGRRHLERALGAEQEPAVRKEIEAALTL